MDQDFIRFFQWSDLFDHMVTRQLAHVKSNWELIWDHNNKQYEPEDDSFADMINNFVIELSQIEPPTKYHDNEDRLAEYCKSSLRWDIKKCGNRWIGAPYAVILEQGAYKDINQQELLFSISGRIKAALALNQVHFDDMEDGHQKILANVIAIFLFHREMYA